MSESGDGLLATADGGRPALVRASAVVGPMAAIFVEGVCMCVCVCACMCVCVCACACVHVCACIKSTW